MINELTWSPASKERSYAQGQGKILESFAIERRSRQDRRKEYMLYPFALFVKTRQGKYHKRVGVFKTREEAQREARRMETHQISSRTC